MGGGVREERTAEHPVVGPEWGSSFGGWYEREESRQFAKQEAALERCGFGLIGMTFLCIFLSLAPHWPC